MPRLPWQLARSLPPSGTVFISVADKQKEPIAPIAKQLQVSLTCPDRRWEQLTLELPRFVQAGHV